jgi:hypothetical protein
MYLIEASAGKIIPSGFLLEQHVTLKVRKYTHVL